MEIEYDRPQFLRLIEAVEDQGGKYLADEPHGHTTYTEATGKLKVKPLMYPGCGHAAQFEVKDLGVESVLGATGVNAEPKGFSRSVVEEDRPVNEADLQNLALPPHIDPIKVCAYEDCVGLWPRFVDQVFA